MHFVPFVLRRDPDDLHLLNLVYVLRVRARDVTEVDSVVHDLDSVRVVWIRRLVNKVDEVVELEDGEVGFAMWDSSDFGSDWCGHGFGLVCSSGAEITRKRDALLIGKIVSYSDSSDCQVFDKRLR